MSKDFHLSGVYLKTIKLYIHASDGILIKLASFFVAAAAFSLMLVRSPETREHRWCRLTLQPSRQHQRKTNEKKFDERVEIKKRKNTHT